MDIIKFRAATLAVILLTALFPAGPARADDAATSGGSSFLSPVADYFANWFPRVAATQAEQPHWGSPVAVTSPLLLQLVRFDAMWEGVKGGHEMDIYGGGKGLEFIPAERIQFIVGAPPWQTVNTNPRKDGWGDESFLMKYRIASANEQEGNYVLTAFMGVTVPNGSDVFSTRHFVYAPTLAGGKGWGDFDVQGSLGTAIPDDGTSRGGPGTPVLANVVLQYKVAKVIWPEVEANYTFWPNGTHENLHQLFITPGLVVGKFTIWKRLSVAFGVGVQVAVTDNPLYHRNVIFSARTYF